MKLENKNVRTTFKSSSDSTEDLSSYTSSSTNLCMPGVKRPSLQSLESSIHWASRDKVESSNNYKLSSIICAGFCCVLLETIEQLIILGCIGNLPKVEANIEYKTLKQRFERGKWTSTLIFDPDTIEPYEERLRKEKSTKFQKDRSYLELVLHQTLWCLQVNGTYNVLVKLINQYNQQISEEDQLLQKEYDHRIELHRIQNILTPERKAMQKQIQNQINNVGKLRDLYQDTIYEIALKKKYLNKWEKSRDEQNSLILDKKEKYYTNVIDNIQIKIDQELRINSEIETHILLIQKEYEDQIIYWRDLYYEELEAYDTKIQLLRTKRDSQLTRLEEMCTLYEKRRQEIEDYLVVREVRIKEAEALQKKIVAAIKIQAWWRGTMVRKCLGPYSNKKGKKGKGVTKNKASKGKKGK